MARGGEEQVVSKATADIRWIAPPGDLKDLVHTLYEVDVSRGELDEPIPAYSAQLLITFEGDAELEYADGSATRIGPVFLNAPQLRAGRVRVSGPFHAVAASLTPLGWASLTGHSIDEVHDCAVEPATFASPAVIRDLAASARAGISRQDRSERGVANLQALLRTAPHTINSRHREFVAVFTSWLGSDLSPSLDALYDRFAMSRRQVQRLSRRFFGASPTQVLMRHRAIRTAMLLSNPDLPQAFRDEIMAAYFDQAHMIRDIRRFTGRTPVDLSAPSLAQESLDPAGHGETAAALRSE